MACRAHAVIAISEKRIPTRKGSHLRAAGEHAEICSTSRAVAKSEGGATRKHHSPSKLKQCFSLESRCRQIMHFWGVIAGSVHSQTARRLVCSHPQTPPERWAGPKWGPRAPTTRLSRTSGLRSLLGMPALPHGPPPPGSAPSTWRQEPRPPQTFPVTSTRASGQGQSPGSPCFCGPDERLGPAKGVALTAWGVTTVTQFLLGHGDLWTPATLGARGTDPLTLPGHPRLCPRAATNL